MPTLAETTPAKNDSLSRYRKLGFKAVNRPEGPPPQLPTKISTTTHDKLGDMQIIYAAWREYAEDLHAEALNEYTIVKSDYDFLVAITSTRLEARTVKDKTNLVLKDQKVQEKRRALLNAETMLNLMASKLDSYSNALQVISRELTRRGLIKF